MHEHHGANRALGQRQGGRLVPVTGATFYVDHPHPLPLDCAFGVDLVNAEWGLPRATVCLD